MHNLRFAVTRLKFENVETHHSQTHGACARDVKHSSKIGRTFFRPHVTSKFVCVSLRPEGSPLNQRAQERAEPNNRRPPLEWRNARVTDSKNFGYENLFDVFEEHLSKINELIAEA